MTPTGPSTRLRIAPSAASAPVARTVVRRLLDDAGVDTEVRQTAELLATELVSNAVEHGGGSSYLDAVVGPDAVRLEVTDPNPALPTPSPSLDDLDERGRGLLLIAALASRWGAERHPPGKTVWCEIALA
ncbi:ATP-binding protein [Nocardioides sp. YIM 152315]|uniref:ATP-binding protein n=1 Tax=Nocardioides sp. YIM 152315 TaxID=3031760 RepID=UPI0023DBF47F|nr:ATP-binding protein [Nocardioides sp. YIM 152315]MDF1605671.1 ATP-binding protein [Nocardioides sp. YIM 152315]